jgi:hypothetical protein
MIIKLNKTYITLFLLYLYITMQFNKASSSFRCFKQLTVLGESISVQPQGRRYSLYRKLLNNCLSGKISSSQFILPTEILLSY